MQLTRQRAVQMGWRLAIPCVAALVLAKFVRTDELVAVCRRADPAYLGTSFALMGLSVLLLSSRLSVVLNAFGTEVRVFDCARAIVLGNLVSLATPFGAVAGDICRVCCLSEQRHKLAGSAWGVLVDRFIGLFALTSLAFLIGGELVVRTAGGRVALLAGATGLILAILWIAHHSAWIARNSEPARRAQHLATRLLPDTWSACWRQARCVWSERPQELILVLGLAVLAHLACVTSLAIMAQALGGGVMGDLDSFLAFAAAATIALFSSALPLGVMEMVFASVLAGAGMVGPEVAVCISLASRLGNLIWVLPVLLVSRLLRARGACSTFAQRAGQAATQTIGTRALPT